MGRLMSMVTCFAMGVLLCSTLAWTQAGSGKVADEVISITKAEWSALMSKNTGSAMKDIHKECTMWVPEYPNRLDRKAPVWCCDQTGHVFTSSCSALRRFVADSLSRTSRDSSWNFSDSLSSAMAL